MKRYKLIGTQNNWPSFTPGKIYGEDYLRDSQYPNCTVEHYADNYPHDWELVEDDFTLPEKWCVKDNLDNVDVITNWFTKKLKREISGGSNYWHFPEEIICRNSICTSKNILPTYTEITFEQFEKYVLNVETNTTMEKQKLIGYKLKPEFESVKEFVHKLESCLRWQSENVIDLYQNLTIQKLKELKVLDIWFEPVYKQNFKLPTIGGYKAVDLGDEVKYGCQTYKVEDIKALYKSLSTLNIKSVNLDVYDINVSIDQILEIVKYFENK